MILKLGLCLLFAGVVPLTAIQKNEGCSLTVTTHGFKNNKGLAAFYLFNSEKTYLKNEQAFRKTTSVISGDSAKVTFTNLPIGIYTVSCFHDENSNGKYDTNFIGYPKEAIGFSGNTKTFMGPPKFQNAKFQLQKSIAIAIALWHP